MADFPPQIFNASHMAGYDRLDATHDMILRFMGMNFSAIADGTARIPSSVGNDVKPSFIENKPALAVPSPLVTKTPEQDKAMWEGMISVSSLGASLTIMQPITMPDQPQSCLY
jgi:carboxypeptidase D